MLYDRKFWLLSSLKCYVNVIKLRKSFLFEEISEIDGQNLLKHIEFSLKVNHYLQQEFLNKSLTIKSFENFLFWEILVFFQKAEVRIRLGLFENMINLPKIFDDIKMQFLENDFINYIFKNMIFNFRNFKKNIKN